MKTRISTLLVCGLMLSVASAGSPKTAGHEFGATNTPDSWEIGTNKTPDGVTWFGNEWTYVTTSKP